MPASIILGAVFGDAILAAAALGAVGYAAASFAINMLVSSIITKALAPGAPNTSDNQNNPNPGNRQQMPPATDNKLPVVYGTAYVGGVVTDLSITSDNQVMFFCLALSEVTGTYDGAPADAITFGDIYWGGKKCIFDTEDPARVISLNDESTGGTQTNIDGKLFIYTYSNGSYSPTNTTMNAIEVMQAAGLTYKWDSTKLMSNCAFAIVKVIYNQDAGLAGLQQTKFQITNARKAPGDCLLDYMRSTRYGAAIPDSQIDHTSLTALNTYSNGDFTYTKADGGTATQKRFQFDGTVDAQQTIMNCLQQMGASCDCLLRYNEMTATWGVIVQSPAYSVAMAINDSNMVSAIQITPTDLSSTPNIIESKFANSTEKDSFASAVFSLQQLAPSLLYPNEPVNKQSVALPLVNNDVRAQYIATRLLKAGREDLIVKVQINYAGLQLEAGDIISVTSTNYGWTNKLFRLSQVVQIVADDGQVTASLTLIEFNPSVYDDSPITQFTPAPNTGIPTPLAFGTVYAPTLVSQQPSAATPSFGVSVIAASTGISQYAEIWYSAFSSPTANQLIFIGTTSIQSAGNPFTPGQSMGTVTVGGIPQGDWYFFVRMINSLGSSQFSAASEVLAWRPTTFQFSDRWIAVAYADNATGTVGFSLNPRNKTYYGLLNSPTANGSTDPTKYTWYAGTFGSSNYLLIANRQNRKFSFAVGNAGFSNLGGVFVPTETSIYDTSIWGALEDGQNYIDLDARTGQLTRAGTTAISSADGLLSVTNNTQGSMVVSLQKFLNFGSGVYSKTFNSATLTIDVYGRVVGFTQPDEFFYTEQVFSATSGQTAFLISHTVGTLLVFRDGILVGTGEYTETSAGFTLSNACVAGQIIIAIIMRATSTDQYYEHINAVIASSTSNSITYVDPLYQIINAGDLICFAATQPGPTDTPTLYTVQSINTTTKTITFTTSISGATAGFGAYRSRAAGSTYAPFSRYEFDVSNINSLTPSNFTIRNGFEMIYFNGVQINEIDYDLSGNTVGGFPAPVTGKVTFIMFSENNFSVPASNVVNTVAYSINGALSYVYPNNPLSMEVYANGALLTKGASYDYTATAAGYNLTTAFNNNFTLLNQQTFARIGPA